jgi:hypothetical protein
VLLFVASIAAAAGAYLWQQYLHTVADNYKAELTKRDQQYQIDSIAKIKADTTRIDLAKRLLSTHLSTSQIFSILSRLTVENVQFTSMDVSAPSSDAGIIKLALTGYGLNFSTVAAQSDVLSQLDKIGLDRIVKNPILSAPTLNQNGTVSFELTVSIDPNALLYNKTVTQQ